MPHRGGLPVTTGCLLETIPNPACCASPPPPLPQFGGGEGGGCRGGLVSLTLISGVKMSHRFFFLMLIGPLALASLSGCGGGTPAIVPVKGTVLLNGQPLPKAIVKFQPQQDGLSSEFFSFAETDENGQFTLTCGYKDKPGAVVGKHVVLITESPEPKELRQSRDRREHEDYRAKLGNRPIPLRYASIKESPLKIEIKEGQEDVKLELTR